jgi:hypothetical protein
MCLYGYKGQRGPQKKTTKVTYICRSPKKKVVTYFISFLGDFFGAISRFWAFRTRKNRFVESGEIDVGGFK